MSPIAKVILGALVLNTFTGKQETNREARRQSVLGRRGPPPSAATHYQDPATGAWMRNPAPSDDDDDTMVMGKRVPPGSRGQRGGGGGPVSRPPMMNRGDAAAAMKARGGDGLTDEQRARKAEADAYQPPDDDGQDYGDQEYYGDELQQLNAQQYQNMWNYYSQDW